MSELQRQIMKSRLPPPIPGTRPSSKRFERDYSPVEWSKYFEAKQDIKVDEKKTFRCYFSKKPTEPAPVIVLLHGGGFSALTWSLFSEEITSIVHSQCLAIDLRGHGDSVTDDENDLSANVFSQDISDIIQALYPQNVPPILLVGHSMGGAISVHVAHAQLIPSLIGVTVIDVVEGTAMDALTSMQSFLRSRPTYFKSIPDAIQWCIRSGQIRNIDSAKVSMPGQIINCKTLKLATNELPLVENPQIFSPAPTSNSLETVSENTEDEADKSTKPTFFPPAHHFNDKNYTWRIDLAKSESFWPGWFENLSDRFLNLSVPKLLLLASIDGLDRSLTVGQMQGKFQMQVLARCGHAVHEDRPSEVAEVIASFMVRNRFTTPYGEINRHMPAC